MVFCLFVNLKFVEKNDFLINFLKGFRFCCHFCPMFCFINFLLNTLFDVLIYVQTVCIILQFLLYFSGFANGLKTIEMKVIYG